MTKQKSEEQTANELSKMPLASKPPREEPKTNRVCGCGRKIGENDSYYIRIESQELPEIFCDFCVELIR